MSSPLCPRCNRPLLTAAELSEQAHGVRALVGRALAIEVAGAMLADGYGGDARRVLRTALEKAAMLSFEHAKSADCLAGTCIVPPNLDEILG